MPRSAPPAGGGTVHHPWRPGPHRGVPRRMGPGAGCQRSGHRGQRPAPGRCPVSETATLGQLAAMIADPEGYIDRRAAKLAAPQIAAAEEKHRDKIAELEARNQRLDASVARFLRPAFAPKGRASESRRFRPPRRRSLPLASSTTPRRTGTGERARPEPTTAWALASGRPRPTRSPSGLPDRPWATHPCSGAGTKGTSERSTP